MVHFVFMLRGGKEELVHHVLASISLFIGEEWMLREAKGTNQRFGEAS